MLFKIRQGRWQRSLNRQRSTFFLTLQFSTSIPELEFLHVAGIFIIKLGSKRSLSDRSGIPPHSFSTRLNNLFWETALGISTRGIVDVHHPDSYHYATMSYFTIQKVLSFLSLQKEDVLIDIGCGKGRVLCLAARTPLQKVIGVDLSKELCEIARTNAERLRGRRSPIVVHNSNAEDFDYSQGTVFILFNPFGSLTLDTVLSKIHRDVHSHPVRIAYANPAHDDVFAAHSWLQPYERWDKEKLGLEHSVSFYQSV